MLSTVDYGLVAPRLVGIMTFSIGYLVFEIIRFRVKLLYPATIVIRLLMGAVFLSLYFYTSNPLFITMLLIGGVGVILTIVAYIIEK